MIPNSRKNKIINHNLPADDYFGTLATKLDILCQENKKPDQELINELMWMHQNFIITRPKIYRYSVDDLNVSTLLTIWKEVVRSGKNEVRIDDLDLTTTQKNRRTQLRFHGLIARVLKQNGTQKPGYWLLTERGAKFLKGDIVINRYVITQNNKVIDHSSNLEEKESNKWIHKNEFKVLDNFKATYEIINGAAIKIKTIQPSLI